MVTLYDAVNTALTDLQPMMLLEAKDEVLLADPYARLLKILPVSRSGTDGVLAHIRGACEALADCVKFARNNGHPEIADNVERVNKALSLAVALNHRPSVSA